MKLNIINQINIPKIIAKVDNSSFRQFLTNEIYRYTYKYIPYNTGALAKDVKKEPKKIKFNAKYAKATYNGKKLNFKKDRHSLATSEWVEKGAIIEMPKIIKSLRGYLKTHI